MLTIETLGGHKVVEFTLRLRFIHVPPVTFWSLVR